MLRERAGGLGATYLTAAGAVLATLVLGACGAAGGPPRIESVSPSSVVLGQTKMLLISGSGFRNGAEVRLGGTVQAAKVTWVNSSYLTATLPPEMQPLQYSVEVTNPDGQRAVGAQPIAVVPVLPTVSATAQPTKSALPPTPSSTPTRSPTPTPTASPTRAATPTAAPTQPPVATPVQNPPVVIQPGTPIQPGERTPVTTPATVAPQATPIDRGAEAPERPRRRFSPDQLVGWEAADDAISVHAES